jgi:hypothetical protein
MELGQDSEAQGRSTAGDAMPANTIALSQMMRELSANPEFTGKLLDQMQVASKAGALLTPDLLQHMREIILGKDWQKLDRFPGWTMREINPAVRVVGHLAGKDPDVTDKATAGGAPSEGAGPVSRLPERIAEAADLGPYGVRLAQIVDLDQSSTLPGFNAQELVSDLGEGVVRGDGPNPAVAPMHSESARLADLLNRLSLNGQDGVATLQVRLGGKVVSKPEDLIAALMVTGHQVMVADSRYFANFGHLHFKGAAARQYRDVMMPFWVNSKILVPDTNRPLLVPVSHAEYEWFVRAPGAGSGPQSGPRVDADVSFYFGIDGKAEWRTMDQLDQSWVMNRHAHEYRGADAVEVTRLSGAIVRAYLHQHQTRPRLPFGGYYALGVCQDVVALIELKMTGKTTLFPNTADAALFDDPRDAEINKLIRRIPKDREGNAPQVSRIFGSLPVSEQNLGKVTIPGLAPDLIAVHSAWREGTLQRTRPRWRVWLDRALFGAGFLLALGVAGWLWWRSQHQI